MDKNKVGVVVIGRNEGKIIRRNLQSVLAETKQVVYVDSGSTDDSLMIARSLGVSVIEIDASRLFSAGRARNAGCRQLLRHYPAVEFVQFVDGDCHLVPGWLSRAYAKMGTSASIAVVFGRRREQFPENSRYNHLCDMEWNTPPGEAQTCGGDAFMRVSHFQQAKGFNPVFAAGEEPEMCFRLQQQGKKIWCLEAEMTRHDADMHSLKQWWRRTMRSGRAYAQNAWTHGREPERFQVKESLSIWFYALIIPVTVFALLWFTKGLSLLLLLIYPWLYWRVYGHRRAFGDDSEAAKLYAQYCVLGKFPQLVGQIHFLLTRDGKLIEYKSSKSRLVEEKVI